MNIDDIGRQVKDARQRLGLTQEELAQKVGYDVRTIQRLEAKQSASRNVVNHVLMALGLRASAPRPDQEAGETFDSELGLRTRTQVVKFGSGVECSKWIVANTPRRCEVLCDADDEGLHAAIVDVIKTFDSMSTLGFVFHEEATLYKLSHRLGRALRTLTSHEWELVGKRSMMVFEDPAQGREFEGTWLEVRPTR